MIIFCIKIIFFYKKKKKISSCSLFSAQVSSIFWLLHSDLHDIKTTSAFEYMSSMVANVKPLSTTTNAEQNYKKGQFHASLKRRNGRVRVMVFPPLSLSLSLTIYTHTHKHIEDLKQSFWLIKSYIFRLKSFPMSNHKSNSHLWMLWRMQSLKALFLRLNSVSFYHFL